MTTHRPLSSTGLLVLSITFSFVACQDEAPVVDVPLDRADRTIAQTSMSAYVAAPEVPLEQVATLGKDAKTARQIIAEESWSMTAPYTGNGTITPGFPISTDRSDLFDPDGEGTRKQNVPKTDNISPIASLLFSSNTITGRDVAGATVHSFQMDANQSDVSQALNSQIGVLYRAPNGSRTSLARAAATIGELTVRWREKGYIVQELGGGRYELRKSTMPAMLAASGKIRSGYAVTMVFNANTMRMEGGSTSRDGNILSEITFQPGSGQTDRGVLHTKTYLGRGEKGRKDVSLFTRRNISRMGNGGGR